jgi:tRNA pseudouridine38-40 synthase
VIQDGRCRDVFLRRHAWWIPRRLDVDRMKQAAEPLIGTHDFRSFETAGSPRVSTVRTVRDLTVERRQATSETIEIEIEADGFLYNMVRNIVGTLALVGRGDQPPEWVAEVLSAKDRRVAGMNAPPQGLFLVKVHLQPSCESPTSSRA